MTTFLVFNESLGQPLIGIFNAQPVDELLYMLIAVFPIVSAMVDDLIKFETQRAVFIHKFHIVAIMSILLPVAM